ncbi:unnamed protein product [Sphacelaria rigidula]
MQGQWFHDFGMQDHEYTPLPYPISCLVFFLSLRPYCACHQIKKYTGTEPISNPIRLVFRVCALGLGVLMVMSSVVELFNVSSFTRLCIAMYNLLFAAVLMLHESQGFVTCDEVDWTMRRYFGLLYGHMGRAIFIIFIAFLNFALTDAAWWGTITGLLLLALGVSMVLIYMKYPHLLDEAPGLGDLKTPAPRPQGYAPPPAMPSTAL